MRGYTAIRCLNFLVNNWFFTLAVSVSRFAYDANNLIANDCGEIKSNFPIGFEQGMQDFNTSGIYAPPAGSHERNDLIMPEVILSFISAAIFALAIRQG
ncbi:MAG: hypothetical protein K0S29_1174, partial [Gammaproteobacteria bacterium]|nr:hypothetical protein [Gammaproteobacteria bacterium]